MDAASHATQPAAAAPQRPAADVPADRGPDRAAGRDDSNQPPLAFDDPAPAYRGEQRLDALPRNRPEGGRATAPVGRAGQEVCGLPIEADEQRPFATRIRDL